MKKLADDQCSSIIKGSIYHQACEASDVITKDKMPITYPVTPYWVEVMGTLGFRHVNGVFFLNKERKNSNKNKNFYIAVFDKQTIF